MTMDPGNVAKVIREFLTVSDGELNVQRGDIVQIVKPLDRIWCLVTASAGRQGKVPLNNLIAVETPKVGASQTLFVAFEDFSAQQHGDLMFMKGEFITGDEEIDENWWRGHVGSRTGIFPKAYTFQLDTPKVSESNQPVRRFAKVNVSMTGQLDEELDLIKGDTVVVTEQIDRDWYRGESRGRSGIFPCSYVTLLDEPCPAAQDNQFHMAGFSTSNSSYQQNNNFSSQPDNSVPSIQSENLFSSYSFDPPSYLNSTTNLNNSNITVSSTPSEAPRSQTDLITFSPEKTNSSPNWKDAVYNAEFLEDDYFKQNMPYSFAGSGAAVENKINYSSLTGSVFEIEDKTDYDLVPYGITLYPFYAQFDNELSFNEGEIVHLLNHVDGDWIKGEIDGRQGIFPSNYINIVIDCHLKRNNVTTVPFESSQDLQAHTHAQVLFNFTAQMNDDVSVTTGEIVFLISEENEDWWRVRKQDGSVGLCPRNYLCITSDQTSTFQLEDHDVELRHRKIEEPSLRQGRPSTILKRPSPPSSPTTTPRRPSPPSSPPPLPPVEEQEVPVPNRSRRSAPPIPEKPLPPEPSNEFQRVGSDRAPHRPAPPVPAPGQIPVYRPLPRTEVIEGSGEVTDSTATAATETMINSEEDTRKKKSEQRQNVISELAVTEKEYIRDLKITYETFNLHNPQDLNARGVDHEVLFGNILEVTHTSEKLLDLIYLAMKGKDEVDQIIGTCFCDMASELREVYGRYCMNHENALMLLEKYDGNQSVQQLFQKGLEVLRHQIACFDMSSILIKPVQRIMKYPLILNELFKSTEDEHEDKAELLKAVKIMSDVASSINESKRRKDIVSKYLEDGSATLTTRMSRLSLHSVAKMSTRFGAKLSSTLGIGATIKDPAFDEQECMFQMVEKAIRSFIRNLEVFTVNLQDVMMSQLHCSEAIVDFYQELKESVEVFRMTQHTLVSEVFSSFETQVRSRVLQPLQSVLEVCDGPARLIQKRNDKLLDYESCITRAEKNRDPKIQEELNLCKNNYEALNSQLLEELPSFISLASSIFVDCIADFVVTRKVFSARVTKHYLNLLDQEFQTNQSPSQIAYLQSKYHQENLYIVQETLKSSDTFELDVPQGYIVGVIKRQDPMGSSERWYVDDGEHQGFVCHKYLVSKYGSTPRKSQDSKVEKKSNPSPSKYDPTSPPRYEDVVPVEEESTNQQHLYEEIPDMEFYSVMYDFEHAGDYMISLKKGQVIKVHYKHDLDGNAEWWLVEDRTGVKGYVPGNYLVKYEAQ